MERAELGIDGNCGFALLGENIQEGEAEFVEINYSNKSRAQYEAERAAAGKAYRQLKARLPEREFSYFLGAGLSR